MSGIEVIGLAASILQIADLGWKSSYKLYAFSKKVHDASKAIELVSQDIAATGTILKQLGEEIKKDEDTTPTSRLSTQALITAASKLVEECQTLFREIDQGITGEEGSRVILGFKQKLKWSYLEPRLELLRTNLERLKSSLALMLNVLIYAEQQRSRQGATVLKEQQLLVASFAEQKNDSEKRIEELKKRIEAPAPAPTTATELVKPSTQPTKDIVKPSAPKTAMNIAATRTGFTANISAVQISSWGSPAKSVPPVEISGKTAAEGASDKSPFQSVRDEPPGYVELPAHLDHHRLLIENLLDEVNSSKYALDHGLRYRLHDGVLELHWREWQPLRKTYGDQMLQAILSRSPVLARHWYEMSTKYAALDHPKNITKGVDQQVTSSPSPPKPQGEIRSSHQLRPGHGSAQDVPRQKRRPGGARLPSNATPIEHQASNSSSFASFPEAGAASNTEENFNLDFSTLDNSDVLENFDFDSFLNTSNEDAKVDFSVAQPIPSRGYSGENANRAQSYGSYGDRPLTSEEEEEEEEISTVKSEIKFVQPQDVASTRNALRRAMQAEEMSRDTLARLGAQGERLSNTDRNLSSGSHQNDAAANKAKELKTLNRSMFAVHVNNPFTAGSQYNHPPRTASKDAPPIPKKQMPAAERSKYQFEADSEDDDEIDNETEPDRPLDELSGAAKRLNLLARATGSEVEAQASHLSRMVEKSDHISVDPSSIDDDDAAARIANDLLREWTTVDPIRSEFNNERLRRIR